MADPKVGAVSQYVIVSRQGGTQEVSKERAETLKQRFYPTLFKDGTDEPVFTKTTENQAPTIAVPGQESATGSKKLDSDAINQLTTSARAEGVSAARRAQTIKTLLLQDQPNAVMAVLTGAQDQGLLSDVLVELSTLDGPGTWTTRLALTAPDPAALCRLLANTNAAGRAAALSVIAVHAESDAGHAAVSQLLGAASRDNSLDRLVHKLDTMRTGEIATTREVLIASMASLGDRIALLMLGASGKPNPDGSAPADKVTHPTTDTGAGAAVTATGALPTADVPEVLKSAHPQLFAQEIERGLREAPAQTQQALAALAVLREQGLVLVEEGAIAKDGVVKEAFWGVITADDYARVYGEGHTHVRTRPEVLEWELTEATRYADEVLNLAYDNGSWRPRTATETAAVLRQRYPHIFSAPSADGRVAFNADLITAPSYEIRDNQLISDKATFAPAGFARAIAETDLMLTFHELASAHPSLVSYDGFKQLTVRTGDHEIRLEIQGDRVFSPDDAPDDVRTGAALKAWVARVAQPDPEPAKPTGGPLQAYTDAVRTWQSDLQQQLGFAGVEFQLLPNNQARLVLKEQGGTEHEVAILNTVDDAGQPLSAETAFADAELALAEFLWTSSEPMPDNPEPLWRTIVHEGDHYAKSLGHTGVIAVPHGTDPGATRSSAFDPGLTYDFYLIDKDGNPSLITDIKLAAQGGDQMWTPSVCIRELRSAVHSKHADFEPQSALQMTPANWAEVNNWMQYREPGSASATASRTGVSFRDQAGQVLHRTALDLPEGIEVQVINDNLLRFVNTRGSFQANHFFGPSVERDFYVGYSPINGEPAFDYLIGGTRSGVSDLSQFVDTMLFNSFVSVIAIGGGTMPVRGPGQGQRYELTSGNSSVVYDAKSGEVELGQGWHDGGVPKLLDADISDGSVVVHIDYSGRGDGVQVWKLDLDFDSDNPGRSYQPKCIFNTTGVTINPNQDLTNTDVARAELARLAMAGEESKPSATGQSFAALVAGSNTIDGHQLVDALQRLPDTEATNALNTLLAMDPARVPNQEALAYAIRQLAVVESIPALDRPRGDDNLRAQTMVQLAAAHDVFVNAHGNIATATATLRRLVAQAAAADLSGREAPGARVSIFLSLAYQEREKLAPAS